MSAISATFPAEKSKAFPAILWGGLTAGILDLTAAFIRWGSPLRITKGIASGLLWNRAVIWGFLYGIAVYMFMSWVLVPLSAFPKSKAPFSLTASVLSLLTHMFCVGLPIALAVRRYSR